MKNDRKTTGAVLVLGSGIAGMQSAQDLANAGYLVHLVTDSPSIGGKMSQLDKTFPTNECAMCLLGPKMNETQSHPNIKIHTVSKIVGLEGEAGNFVAKVKKTPRYIDVQECTACGDCEQVCPVELPNKYNQEMGTRKATYKLFPQAVPNKFLIDKKGTPPCRQACPAGVNVQGYVQLTKVRKFDEALELVHKNNPLASICGRICTHPCEEACNRGKVDQPIAIKDIKRFIADRMLLGENPAPKITEKKDKKVAIVGAGPGGLSAANYLALKGYQVTVFEALPVGGGMLRVGIPEYRLKKDIVEAEINRIQKMGVEIKYNQALGRDFTIDSLKEQGYQAVLLAIGCQKGVNLPIEGLDNNGVMNGVDFLRKVALGENVTLGKRIAVIGGGNVAMDVARTALRLGKGSEVQIYCLENANEMPAWPQEVHEAKEEGIIINNSKGIKKIIGTGGKVTGFESLDVASVFDADGRFNPQYVSGSEKEVTADTILLAIGQTADLSCINNDSVKGPRNRIIADENSLATPIPGVFACGDVVSGPATAVQAIGAGNRAAAAIEHFLEGGKQEDFKFEFYQYTPPSEDPFVIPEDMPVMERQVAPILPADERKTNFNEVESCFTEEMAVAEAERCMNCGGCCECFQCVEACKKKIIDHTQQEEIVDLNVGSIVLVPGFDLYDAKLKGEYGYGVYENVITSLEFERFLSATGPTEGHICRPSDHKDPVKIAWIQCVGSRDCNNASEYCSSICCMYATKEAIIAKEHDKRIQPTIFYLDIRSFGKNFDNYVNSAKENGVRYVRSMISKVKEDPKTKNLFIQYMADGKLQEEEFELVVLSVGVRPPKEAELLSKTLGFELNEYGFAKTDKFNPTKTTRDGIFVAGAFQGPRDIPETVMNASAAAGNAGAFLADSRGTMMIPKLYPDEIDVLGQEPRIGVFVCHCGINIAGVVDVKKVVENVKHMPGVVHCQDYLYTCSEDTIKQMRELIQEKGLNRIIVASCTVRTHRPLFQEGLRGGGLNQFYFEMANIRDQCSWVHRDNPERATLKAIDLVKGAIGKVRLHEPLYLEPSAVVQKALVVGGGVAGMNAALSFAEQGFPCYLIEKEKELGGTVRNIYTSLSGENMQEYLNDLITKVKSNPLIEIYNEATVYDFNGHQGNFITTISQPSGRTDLNHGVVVIATGAKEKLPQEFLYGESDKVVTGIQLEAMLNTKKYDPNTKQVVMIQCVSSPDEDRPKYCSRTCCGQSVKNALQIKKLNPDTQVFVLYRDMRTYGYYEKYYKEAREKGVIFIPVDSKEHINLSTDGNSLSLKVLDAASQMTINLKPDILALASGAEAYEGIERIAQLMKLTLNENGFFVETHAKLAPIDFPSQGIFLCGAAHSPKFVDEAIYQAQGAVARACTILSKENLMVGGVVAVVDEDKCAACLTCVRACPYGVPKINERHKAQIETVQCQGCGTCAGECPGKAIQLQHYKDAQLIAKVEGMFYKIEDTAAV
ncbi:FAD-dependent oxidoreductase [Desulfolucanica intricata]|uniref:FAD-dependent oxidoreductase n=1 Tax=Desulfolucanica intricata TaxID=1285191 RepID=UPI000A4D1CAA|nr:FAD-dependent oxidoreductase [Desulfolucanica intricata]